MPGKSWGRRGGGDSQGRDEDVVGAMGLQAFGGHGKDGDVPGRFGGAAVVGPGEGPASAFQLRRHAPAYRTASQEQNFPARGFRAALADEGGREVFQVVILQEGGDAGADVLGDMEGFREPVFHEGTGPAAAFGLVYGGLQLGDDVVLPRGFGSKDRRLPGPCGLGPQGPEVRMFLRFPGLPVPAGFGSALMSVFGPEVRP